MAKTVEFRGCDNLVMAKVTADSASTGYAAGTVIPLAPVAEIAKTVENSSETHYYDNIGMIIIRSEGSDEITLTVPALPLTTLAQAIGKTVDETTGAFIDSEADEVYWAIGYRLRLTDGTFRYVWRLKGSFSIPDETSATENSGTDTNNQTLVYTGVKTIAKFNYDGKHAKGVVLDERDGKCDLTTFFDKVQTPDTIGDLAISSVTALSISPTTDSVVIGGTTTITPTTTPANANVVWRSSNNYVATVDGGVVTAVSAGVAVITATAGAYSASCTITVTET